MKFLDNVNPNNLMLINIIYHKPMKESEESKKYTDYLDIIYKDINTNKKYLYTIENPQMEYYVTKEQYRNYRHNKNFIEKEYVSKVKASYKNLTYSIAKHIGGEYFQFYKDCIQRKERYSTKELHNCPYVFGSDYDIESYYWINWFMEYNNEKPKKITKSFLDIEVDIIDIEGFAEDGECPINAITYIDDEENNVYTFLLDNSGWDKRQTQISDFRNNIDSFIVELHETFDESYGKLNYNIYMYEDEEEMLIDLFKLINTLKRDFLGVWNMPFDIPYIMARLEKLGLDPRDVMCHPDFPIHQTYFYKDMKNRTIKNKVDHFTISSYTSYVDQMVIYASIRKGGSELRSYSLNYVAQKELEDEKLNYSEETDIRHLPYKNYKKFVMYNIKDVLLQKGIENKTTDFETLYSLSYNSGTPYKNVFKQTRFLENLAYINYFNNGYIIGNNNNMSYTDYSNPYTLKSIDDEDDDKKFKGAIVGDPLLNSNTGIEIYGSRSKYIYDNVIDMDFSSMYPNIIISFNIAPNCMVGKIYIDENEKYNVFNEDGYDAGKDFIDNLLVGDTNFIGKRWFNLPTIEEIYEELKDVICF